MAIWYQLCKDLTLEQCNALLVYTTWPRAERQAAYIAITNLGTPGYCAPDVTYRGYFRTAINPDSWADERYLIWKHSIGAINVTCGSSTPGFLPSSSPLLSTLYGYRLLYGLSANPPKSALLNFLNSPVLIPDGR